MNTVLRTFVAVAVLATLVVPCAQADPWFQDEPGPVADSRSPDAQHAAARARAATLAVADRPGVDVEWIQRLPAAVVPPTGASESGFRVTDALAGAAAALAAVAVLVGLLALGWRAPRSVSNPEVSPPTGSLDGADG